MINIEQNQKIRELAAKCFKALVDDNQLNFVLVLIELDDYLERITENGETLDGETKH